MGGEPHLMRRRIRAGVNFLRQKRRRTNRIVNSLTVSELRTLFEADSLSGVIKICLERLLSSNLFNKPLSRTERGLMTDHQVQGFKQVRDSGAGEKVTGSGHLADGVNSDNAVGEAQRGWGQRTTSKGFIETDKRKRVFASRRLCRPMWSPNRRPILAV